MQTGCRHELLVVAHDTAIRTPRALARAAVVTVEAVGGDTALDKLGLEGERECGLASARQTRKPDGAATEVLHPQQGPAFGLSGTAALMCA